MLGRALTRIAPWLLASLFAVCVALLNLSLVATQSGQRLDELAMRAVSGSDAAVHASAEGILSKAASIGIGGCLVIVVIALLRRRALDGVLAVAVVGLSILITKVAKLAISRPRFGIGYSLINSYPSGHSTLAAGLAVGLLLVAPPRLRWLMAIIAAAGAATFGYATVVARWHRPSDVLGAVLVAATCGAIAVACRTPVDPKHCQRGVPEAVLAVLGALLSVASAALFYSLLGVKISQATAEHVATAQRATATGVVGACALAIGLLGFLLARRTPINKNSKRKAPAEA